MSTFFPCFSPFERMETFTLMYLMLRKTNVVEDQEKGHLEQIYQDQPWPVLAQDLTARSEGTKGKQRVPATPKRSNTKGEEPWYPSNHHPLTCMRSKHVSRRVGQREIIPSLARHW